LRKEERSKSMIDDEMRNPSGLLVPFILQSCIRSRTSRTLVPLYVCKYIAIFASKQSVLLRKPIVELEMLFSIVSHVCATAGGPRSVNVVMFDPLFRFENVQSSQSASLSQQLKPGPDVLHVLVVSMRRILPFAMRCERNLW
jgi:hypothetical protein